MSPWVKNENQIKKRKKWRYDYRKSGIKQRFNIEDTENLKKLHMERYNEASHNLFVESRAQSVSLQICINVFTITIYIRSNIW